jgi:iron complex transport system substrate-binding protein
VQFPLALRRWEGRTDSPRARRPVSFTPALQPSREGAGSNAGFVRHVAHLVLPAVRPVESLGRARTVFVFSGLPRWTVALLLGAAACAKSERSADTAGAAAAVQATDDAGHLVTLAHPARRVVSLIPSATETLIAIGATPQLVGRTRYDVAPQVASLPSVGGTVDASVEALVALAPELVIAWDTDKRQQVRAKLVALGVPVFVMRTQDTADVFRGIANLGRLTGHVSAATAVAATVRAQLDSVRRSVAALPTPSVFYVVYNDPPMTAGSATFLGQLISLAGGRSIFADLHQSWPTVALEEIVRRQPDVLIVPVGEFRTNTLDRFRRMPGWRDLRAVREGRIVTVPADLSSRPGPAIGEAARVLRDAIHRDFMTTAP